MAEIQTRLKNLELKCKSWTEQAFLCQSTQDLLVGSVCEALDTDDYIVHLCDIRKVYVDESVDGTFGWNGYAEFAPAKKGLNVLH